MNKTGRKKYRIKSRARFTIFIVVLLLITATAASAVLGFSNANGTTKKQYVQVQVKPGDTLWTIADEYMPSDMDKRTSVHMISKKNNTSASEIYPGQVLDIPVEI